MKSSSSSSHLFDLIQICAPLATADVPVASRLRRDDGARLRGELSQDATIKEEFCFLANELKSQFEPGA